MKKYLIILIAFACFSLPAADLFVRKEVVIAGANGVLITNVVFETAPAISNGMDQAKKVAPLLPENIGNFLTGLMTIITIVLGWFAKWKSDHAKSLQGQLTSVVKGVAAVGDEDTKIQIKAQAMQAGVEDDLAKTVLDKTVKKIETKPEV